MGTLEKCFDQRDIISECYRYIFCDSYEALGLRSTQYLLKWVSTFRLLQKQGGQVAIGRENIAARQGRKGTNKKMSATIKNTEKSYSRAHRDWMLERGPDRLREGVVGGDR